MKKLLLSCREVWCYDDCDYIIVEETEEDVMVCAAEHSIVKHGGKETYTVSLMERLRGFIYTISY
jgi:Protein of unknown function (DUF1059)